MPSKKKPLTQNPLDFLSYNLCEQIRQEIITNPMYGMEQSTKEFLLLLKDLAEESMQSCPTETLN